MDATNGAGQPALDGDFGSGRLFLADSRLAYAVLNYARHRTLERVFGVSPAQVNLLTFALALATAEAAYTTARRLIRAPFGLTGADATMAGFALREAAFGLAGPASREVPLFGPLLALALLGGVGLPGLRRAARGMRATEHRVRTARLRLYRAALAAQKAGAGQKTGVSV